MTKKEYPGIDPASWVVRVASGKIAPTSKNGGEETFPGYKDAAYAAKKYTADTGEYAQAVRK